MKQNQQGREMFPEPMKKLREELDTAFDRFFKEPFMSASSILQKDKFSPICNIDENDEKYYIEADMPGVNEDNIEIEINGKQLTVKGERKKKIERTNEKSQSHIVEQNYGTYYQSFTLPENADTEEISADYNNGVLIIDIPKTANHYTRRIKIGKQHEQ